ncbi:MAG: cadherin-like beta sandwich domain-containing protein [Oscillospiraceae bacterium]|nr:cadherin-like beta sandwich domain-containing protein [Oscillospiraceae bacterium]
MKNKFLKIFLTLALCLVMLLPQQAEAASASLTGKSSIQAGSDVTLTLKVSGSGVMGVEATLNYDSSVLEYRSYSGLLSGWDVVPNGTKFVMYGVGNPINSSTGVVSVTFRVKSGLSVDTALSASFSGIVVSDGNADSSLGSASWSGKVSAAPSNNCAISSLTCSNATLSPEFSSSTTAYTTTVPFDVTSLDLSWKTADSGASVSVSGNNLVVGENTVTVTCTAPSGVQKYYVITVTRQQDPNYKPSDVALLSELTLDAARISPSFSGAVTEYVAYVPFETMSVTLTGVAKDEKALQVTEDTRQLVNEGETVLSVTCTAEDGVTKKTYTVHVYRMPKYEGIIPTMEIIDPNAEPEIPSFAVPMVLDLPIVGEVSTLTVAVVAAVVLVLLLFLLGFLIGRSGHDSSDDDDDTPPPVRRTRESRRYDRIGADPVDPPVSQPKAVIPPMEEVPAPAEEVVSSEVEPTAAPAVSAGQAPAAEEDLFFDVAEPIAPAKVEKPKEEKKPFVPVSAEDGISSPFVEDLSVEVQQELYQRREASEEPAEAASFFTESSRTEEEVAADESVGTMSLQDLLDDIRNM